jgi:predicted SAM-dependent methyltransferase
VSTQPGTSVRRLNWGCGEWRPEGWINSDLKAEPGVDIACDIREGLPLADESIDYIVSVHALPEIPYEELIPVLQELRRVLTPDGVLRLSLPDFDKAIDAYRAGNAGYFHIGDSEWKDIGAKMIIQLLWYGHSRMLFTYGFAKELLEKAGFTSVSKCSFKQTSSPYPDIVELDNREEESLFVEATK